VVLQRSFHIQDTTVVHMKYVSKLGCHLSFNLSDLILGVIDTCLLHCHF